MLSLKYAATGAGAFAEVTSGATASFAVSAEGVTTVNYSASDDEGGASEPESLTIRIDRTLPTLAVPASTVVANATGVSGVGVDYVTSAADGGSGVGAPVCLPASGTTFPVGRTTVTCNVSDVAGNAAAPKSFDVVVTRPCIAGTRTGPLKVPAGDSACVGAGGNQVGPVTVGAGGTLEIDGGAVTGPITVTGAALVRICGATITGPVTISGSTELVVVGGADATGTCAPNVITGPVVITGNSGGVVVVGNRITGPLDYRQYRLAAAARSGPVHATGNVVTGPVTIQS